MGFRRILYWLLDSKRASRRVPGRDIGPSHSCHKDLPIIEALNELDPLQRQTHARFIALMEDIMQDQSVQEGTRIAHGSAPAPPPGLRGGSSNPEFQHLMLEWATIRREIDRQGAAGRAEELRLEKAVGNWQSAATALQHAARIDADRLQALREDFRRSILILDSIARRDVTTLKKAIFRFNHLRRSLGIGSP